MLVIYAVDSLLFFGQALDNDNDEEQEIEEEVEDNDGYVIDFLPKPKGHFFTVVY